MPSFSDSIFIFVLALMLFGPKKLPQLARQLGRLMAEFRRASNEFRMQMEDELRIEEQKEHQKKVSELAGPPSSQAPLEDLPHPHMPSTATTADAAATAPESTALGETELAETEPPPPPDRQRPIAESGSLRMMAPSTGLPMSHRGSNGTAAAGGDVVVPEHTILPPAPAPAEEPLSSAGISSDEPAAESTAAAAHDERTQHA